MIFADERIIINHLKNVIIRYPKSKCAEKLIKTVSRMEKEQNKHWRMYL